MTLHFIDGNPRRMAEAHRNKDIKPAAFHVARSLAAAGVVYDAYQQPPINYDDHIAPLTEWTAASRSNWRHMVDIGFALLFEYSWREGKTIEDVKKTLSWARSATPYNMPELGLQKFPLYCDPEYQNYGGKSPVWCWRVAYVDADNVTPDSWDGRDIPVWYIDAAAQLVSGRKQLIETKKAEHNAKNQKS